MVEDSRKEPAMRTLPSIRGLVPMFLAALLCVTLAPATGSAKDKPPLPPAHGDDDVKSALERFDKDYESEDMDVRLNILNWLGRYRHKSVVKKLKKIWLKETDLELVSMAAIGLGNQASHPKDASKLLMQGLAQYKKLAGKAPEDAAQRAQEDLEASVLVNAIEGIGKLDYRGDWKKLKGFIDHNSDDVAIAIINYFGKMKEYKALPVIYLWFEHYPDGLSWSGGSVKVDTGASGNKDANAAKAKWKAKYGSRAKKARPNAFRAMLECVQKLTGEKMQKREELKIWMDENKKLLKRHGV